MLPGSTVGGRFHLECVAGSGGMGTVFRATDTTTGEPVAVKWIRDRSVEAAQRYIREAETLRVLDHPRIVRYVAHGTSDEGDPYLVMAWLDGEDLAARLHRGWLGVEESLALVSRIAEALGAAHARGIVHRDIKPSNVFLVGGDLERPVLLDFGIARQLEGATALTRTGAIVGTLQYMAPEQARGERVLDGRTDVFALGCVLYECLTGQSPFDGGDGLALIARVLFDDPPRISATRPVGADVEGLVARMLAKDRAMRPVDGAAVALDIETLGQQRTEGRLQTERLSAPLGGAEQRVVSVVVATIGSGSEETLGTGSSREVDERLASAAAKEDARIELLGDGLVVASVASRTGGGDQAIRATRLALAVQQILAAARVSVATGFAMVTSGRVDGAIVRRAATLGSADDKGLATTAPSLVRVDSSTAGSIEGRFELVREGDAIYVRSERAVATVRRHLVGRDVPCIGRDRESAALDGALAECAGDGVARAAVISGEPGMGKTRLCEEFVERARVRHGDILVLRGRGEWGRSGSPFAMLSPALRDAAGVRAEDGADAQRAALRVFAATWCASDLVEPTAGFLGEIVGVKFPDDSSDALEAARRDAQLMADGTRSAWVSAVDALSRERCVVLLLEDLHWGDLPSVRLVDIALQRLPDRPLFVLATARPEVREAFPDLWHAREPLEISLTPLSRRAAERLVAAALGTEGAGALVGRICDAAAGNPFVLGELVLSAAAGSSEQIPASVFALLQLRLDALDESERRVLRAASVFGDRFWSEAIGALVDASLHDRIPALLTSLARRDIVAAVATGSLAGQSEHAFRHALLREAAYASIPDDERAPAHAAAATWLERAGERDPMVLARHCESGGVPSRAARFYEVAAHQALAASDLHAAVERGTRALTLAGASGILDAGARGRLELVRAEAQYHQGHLADACDSARRAMDLVPASSQAWFQSVSWLVTSAGQLGNNDEVQRWLDRVADALPEAAARGAQAICLARMMTQLLMAGRSERVERRMERLTALVDGLSRADPQATAWRERVRSTVALRASDIVAAIEAAERAADALAACRDERGLCQMRIGGGSLWLFLGEFERAEESVRHGIAGAERLGSQYLVDWGRFTSGKIVAQRGDLKRAREALEQTLSAVAASPRMAASAAIYLSGAAHIARDPEFAVDAARRALAMSLTAPMRSAALAALSRGEALCGHSDAALEHAAQAMEILEGLGKMEEFEGLIRLAYAEALAACGPADAAHAAAMSAKRRLRDLAANMEPARRDAYLTRVPENVATMALSDS